MNEHRFFSLGAEDIERGGTVVPPVFDTAIDGCIWYRAKLFAPSGRMALSFYASDSKEVPAAGEDFWGERYENPEDVLLYAYRGRYLWVKIELLETGSRFGRLRLYYPAHTFARYLPGIYQRQGLDSFFSRFLAMFQSVYLDMEERIAEFPKKLEPHAADGGNLPVLAGWLGCEEFAWLPEDKRGEFLLACAANYRRYGTRALMEELIGWLGGEKPVIVEYPDMFYGYPEEKSFLGQERILSHYGEDPFRFTVIIHRAKNRGAIPAMLDSMKPAYTSYRLVELKDEVRPDCYTYLGINSYI